MSAKTTGTDEFEIWLRTVCFQKPTPEAYDLAKSAWVQSRNGEASGVTELCHCRQCLRDRGDQEVPGWPAELTRMILCPTCGNKRCPHAEDHRNACTGSNDPGQIEALQKSESSASTQQGGTHYASLAIEPWAADEAWLTREQFVGHLLGGAIDYLARFNAVAPGKGGILDIKKAIHCLTKLVEVLER